MAENEIAKNESDKRAMIEAERKEESLRAAFAKVVQKVFVDFKASMIKIQQEEAERKRRIAEREAEEARRKLSKQRREYILQKEETFTEEEEEVVGHYYRYFL